MILSDWAIRWGVPAAAIADLQTRLLGLDGGADVAVPGRSEAAVQANARFVARKRGIYLWRNNVGAGYSEDGQFMRWGLANDSAQVNKVLKSADLIGCAPRVIQPSDVGKLIGQFVSWECKAEGWRYTGTPREVAQVAWANLVNSLGGEARFVSSFNV